MTPLHKVYNNGPSPIFITVGWDDPNPIRIPPWHTVEHPFPCAMTTGEDYTITVRPFEPGDEVYARRHGPDDRLHEYTDYMAIAAAELVDG